MPDVKITTDCQGRAIRLTEERWRHILGHAEMLGQQERIEQTLACPDIVIATIKDESVHAYHRLYENTPVTRKYLVVVAKMLEGDAFVLTAFFSGRMKKGRTVWQP